MPTESGKSGTKSRVLVAPLDWGLGHATRCIPLIHQLLEMNTDVWLAGEGAQAHLLQTEFPQLPLLELKGYRVKYAATRRGLAWKLLLQLPKLQRAIRQEHQWLLKAQEQYRFDAVISDNRYGLHLPDVPSILLTHQLSIQNPLARWTEPIIRKKLHRYIQSFDACWVPDAEGPGNLSGVLSHPGVMPPVPVYYTGPLSRFTPAAAGEQRGHLLILLSGPEPQRGIMEEIIIREIAHYPGTATVVRGLPGHAGLVPSTGMIRFYNHLPAAEMEKEMQYAGLVIGRSGYSTLMDIAALSKKSVLVPTPGQTEQEYLAEYWEENGYAPFLAQKDFTLERALHKAGSFNYRLPTHTEPGARLAEAIRRFLPTPAS